MELLCYADASRILGVPIGTLYAWVNQRRIPHLRFGPRSVRFRREDLNRWIAEHRVAARDGHGPVGER